LRWLSINAMKSSFFDFDERLALINGVIKPGFDALAAESAFRVSSPPIAGAAPLQDD
jgi:adenosine deaminase